MSWNKVCLTLIVLSMVFVACSKEANRGSKKCDACVETVTNDKAYLGEMAEFHYFADNDRREELIEELLEIHRNLSDEEYVERILTTNSKLDLELAFESAQLEFKLRFNEDQITRYESVYYEDRHVWIFEIWREEDSLPIIIQVDSMLDAEILEIPIGHD